MPSSKKAAALASLKQRRQHGFTSSSLDNYKVKDEGNIYDEMTEEEYKELVEKRRDREDFVVDDDGLGYHDDGEEDIHHLHSTKKSKRTGNNAALTAKTLRQARKITALRQEAQDGGKEEGNRSMWNFVQKGSAAAASAGRNVRKIKSVGLDSLLDELDETPPSSFSRKRKGSGRRRKKYGNVSGRPVEQMGDDWEVVRKEQRERRKREEVQEEEMEEVDDVAVTLDMEEEVAEPEEKVVEKKEVEEDLPAPPLKRSKQEEVKTEEVEMETKEETPTPAAPPARKRLNFAKKKLSRPPKPPTPTPTPKPSTTTPKRTTATSTPSTINTSSASFSPLLLPSTDESTTSPDLQNNAAKFDSLLQTSDEKSYLDMYWIDAHEKNGTIYLYGKVALPSSSSQFVSICILIHNNVRNLFVLPKTPQTPMLNVHQEISNIMKKIVPKQEGVEWKSKSVQRRYAFDDPSIPRSNREYLKVVYSAKFPSPTPELCQNGGESFSRILNGGATPMETFLLKRKLMGPCWIRVYNAKAVENGVLQTWCKMEGFVSSPKDVVRLDRVVENITEEEKKKPAPPIVTMTLKMKTVVHPKTHKNEIVCLSALCHRRVLLDSSTEGESSASQYMSQLNLIRPLGQTAERDGSTLESFPRDLDECIKKDLPTLRKMPNERALLSRFLTQIGLWDPDVICGHNALGFDLDVLLQRCVETKVLIWSKLGRKRKMALPSMSYLNSCKKSGGENYALTETLSGRLVCDTYVSSQELLRETTYSLQNLAQTQLKTNRVEIEQVDVPQWFHKSGDIVNLAKHTLFDAQLVQRLMFKLQVLPLTKQLTCIAGNLWMRTLKGQRAERNEYLLLHEFHGRKYIVPERRNYRAQINGGDGKSSGGGKAKYSGGLVLEPKKGLYDSFILLLDFNSLYPSLIQEYNLCFTTLEDWPELHRRGLMGGGNGGGDASKEDGEGGAAAPKEGGAAAAGGKDMLPNIPDEKVEKGVLPLVIKQLVDRRRAVKRMLKAEKDGDKQAELDIRQKALKLTANSMYGCLGFSHSRFYAQPIAALVTAMGRDTLQRTVDIAQDSVGLEVIYGDTDSIMINTRIKEESQYPEVYKLGGQVKREVNRLYKTLELEIDGVFRSMLLLKKKKYAAVTVSEGPNGKLIFDREEKGLDLVRRDWCVISKDTGKYVLDQILSRGDSEEVVQNIHDHLEKLAEKMRGGLIPLEKFIITKGLNKHPDDYPDAKSQPHVHVARMMIKHNIGVVNKGDHIPYIITAPIEKESNDADQKPASKSKSAVERARHPEEILRSNGVLKPDVEWYLTQQILPPITRLCEPIEGTSQGIIAEKLGLDSTKYKGMSGGGGFNVDDDDLVDYTPASRLPDEERFKDVEKLMMTCSSCGKEDEFPGVFYKTKDAESGMDIFQSGFRCTNPDCPHPDQWGEGSHFACLSKIMNVMDLMVRKHMTECSQDWMQCDDPLCGLKTRQMSVVGPTCLNRGCNGTLQPIYSSSKLHTQLKYLATKFDQDHAVSRLGAGKGKDTGKDGAGLNVMKKELMKNLNIQDKTILSELHQMSNAFLDKSKYNWVESSFFQALFG